MHRTVSHISVPLDPPDEKNIELDKKGSNDSNSGSTRPDREEPEEISATEGEDGAVVKRKTISKKSMDSKRPGLSRITSHLTTHLIKDPGPPPDGGLNAWVQVAMSWLAVLSTWGWVNCFGVFQTYYTLNLPQSASTISWIGTVQTFLAFFIGAFSGRLLDAGYFFPTAITGMALQLLGIFTMSLCSNYWQLMLTQGLLTGIGGGIYFTPCMGILATYFSKKRAFAMGIASTGNSAGGLVYPVIVRQLLPKIGFAWTTRVLGFVNLAILAVVLAFMRPRMPPRKSGPIVDWAAFKEIPYTLFVIAIFFQVWCIYFTLYYITSFGVQAIGLPFKDSTVLLIIVNAIGIPSRLITGQIADRFGQLNTIVPLSFMVAIIAWCWLGVKDIAGVYAYASVYGFIVSAFQCLIPPTVASIMDDLTMIGARIGMVFSVMGFAALTGPPIGGALVDAQGGSYVGAQCWSAASCTICALIIVWTRMNRAKGKIKIKV